MSSEKYPRTIQELFKPKPPLLYIPPGDYPPEKRRTRAVSGVASLKNAYRAHVDALHNQPRPPVAKTNHQLEHEKALAKKQLQRDSHQRQMAEWLKPPELEVQVKDPYRTVFVLRLDYAVSELDVLKTFAPYGAIELVRVVRDHNNRSRGYAFVVFERHADADACVEALARVGIRMGTRTALVDIERGHTTRYWKPMRLGGGHGGRHYTRQGLTASAAATRRHHGREGQSFLLRLFAGRDHHRPAPAPRRPAPPPAPVADHRSVRDKYAKYLAMKY